jgi:multiple sugar transport system permease protein
VDHIFDHQSWARILQVTVGHRQPGPVVLAAAVLMSIPVAVLFFVFQRRIMNTTEGAEKG